MAAESELADGEGLSTKGLRKPRQWRDHMKTEQSFHMQGTPFGSVMKVAVGSVALPLGRTVDFTPRSHDGFGRTRQLKTRDVRRKLGTVPRVDKPTLLTAITDLSGSMWGGNDPMGLRHEALLIALEHIIASPNRRGWHFQMLSFDLNGSIDLPPSPLTKRSVLAIRDSLLGSHAGGTSNLGAAIDHAIATPWSGERAIVVMSDFELVDMPYSTDELNGAPVEVAMALVFSAVQPTQLDPHRVDVCLIDSKADEPDVVARYVWKAIEGVAISQ